MSHETISKVKPSYARLAVILAREAPIGVIFRKGPSRWVQLILWHTDTDTFEAGQWFHGAIIYVYSDLSPDGSKLIYSASKAYILKTIDPEYGEGWTAISRPPYLTALALWPQAAGGYFEDNHTVQLQAWDNPKPHRNHQPPPSLKVLSASGNWYGPNYPLLARNGWTEEPRIANVNESGHIFYATYPIWHKDRGDYRIIMKKIGHRLLAYGGPQFFEFSLNHIPTGVEVPIDTDAWADWDHRDRLVYVNQGRILAGEVENGAIKPHVVGDFNANKPEGIISPDWARVWVD